MGSSATTPQYNAYGGAGGSGCPSTGCVPPTIVPRTNGFWPNADILTGLQIEQQSQNQNQNPNQNQNSNNPQQDDPRIGQPSAGPTGGSGVNSNPQPVIYIARAGSDQYRYSGGLSTPNPIGSGIGNNLNNGNGIQNQFGMNENQNQIQNQQGGIQNPFQQNNQNQNQGGIQNPFQQNQNQNSNNGGFFNNQNQNTQFTGNQGSSQNQNSGSSSGFFNNQNPSSSGNSNIGGFSGSTNQNGMTNSQNQQGNSFNNGQNQNNQFGSTNQGPGLTNGQNNGQFGNAGLVNLPFGPNMTPQNGQFGPQPFQPNQVGSIRQSPQFPEKDWNFQPGSQSVHYIGGDNSGANSGRPQGMTDEAQQIAVQIQAIRDNLSITRDESNYLISQLKSSLPQELQNQLQMI